MFGTSDSTWFIETYHNFSTFCSAAESNLPLVCVNKEWKQRLPKIHISMPVCPKTCICIKAWAWKLGDPGSVRKYKHF